MFLIHNIEAKILFDPSSVHSYLSPTITKKLDMNASVLQYVLTVITPIGKQVIYNSYCPNYGVKIGDFTLPVNSIVLDIHDFDSILRMDWLARYYVSMNCFNKMIILLGLEA